MNPYLDEETVTPNELLPEDHCGKYRSEEKTNRYMCKATHKALSRERNADDNEPRFRRLTETHRAIPLKSQQYK